MIAELQNSYGSGNGSVSPLPQPPAFTLLQNGDGVHGRFRINQSGEKYNAIFA